MLSEHFPQPQIRQKGKSFLYLVNRLSARHHPALEQGMEKCLGATVRVHLLPNAPKTTLDGFLRDAEIVGQDFIVGGTKQHRCLQQVFQRGSERAAHHCSIWLR